ncbi:uncharacterized protein BP5553_04713 [Venustampulla echinocandica]|uniref:Major facilitator superfamily (MFS) profile domain-containing protein n=1 Tax=Venustampulla echinocandica TaxID=2656787 RepID=A0A370TP35_9HELO|nr:uncharacterized protein BP5553_04713 [Venustampulla echinocandica]RDL37280.1 hypothetical protein BP5553_04713 [Venustampulla echinocandica]
MASPDSHKRSRSPAESLSASNFSKSSSQSSSQHRRVRSLGSSRGPHNYPMAASRGRTPAHVGNLLIVPETPLNQLQNPGSDKPSPSVLAAPIRSDSGSSFGHSGSRSDMSKPSTTDLKEAARDTTSGGQSPRRQAAGIAEPESSTSPKSTTGLFPHLPSRLNHFEKWFPESPSKTPEVQDKQELCVEKALPPPPYHVFDFWKKRQLVILMSFTGILSPLSTSIYFPAITAIANEFDVSTGIVLVTITVYMVVQAIAPFFWMPFCSSYGRRPIFIMTLLVFLAADIGLLFCKTFIALLILRGVQSFGTAALTAICAAVIGDISTSKERSTFIGLFGGILMFTFISPLIGGLLTYYLGFRSIFLFLGAFGLSVLVLIVLTLPETLRSIAGNGTIRLKRVQRPFIDIIRPPADAPFISGNTGSAAPLRLPAIKIFVEPVLCLSQKDVVASAVFGSVVFAICTAVIATTTSLFELHYSLSYIMIGLAFLPAGAGSVLSFFSIGHLIDRDFRITEANYRKMHRLEKDIALDYKTLPDFPIERARLRNTWWITLAFIGATAAYGFSFSTSRKLIVLPLVLQFFIACSATAILLLNGTLIADLHTGTVSATPAVNCLRFLMGALFVGTVHPAIDRLGVRLTFLLMALVMLALTPIMVIQWFFGRPWGARRNSTWPRQKLVRLPDLRTSSSALMDSVKGVRLPSLPDVASGMKSPFGKR